MTEEVNSFIIFGTPLEPLDSDELPNKKPVQVQDQKVYDENGLQRFHGAFTGGFSAGYFNTVGTKEGWTPSVFVSSRSQKADKGRQRPEDFMDADDMREYGIAPARVQTTEKFRKDGIGTIQPKNKGPEIIPGVSPLADIIRTKSESMGVILLRKLGWRPGQGIGPRRKTRSNMQKLYGCALPPSVTQDNQGSDGENSDHEIASNYTFAPRDISVLPYKPKDNVQGLGYIPLDRSQFLSVSSMLADSISGHVGTGSKKKKVAFRGQAFGVGAFENDDEDIYGKDDLSRYDFVLGGDPTEERSRTNDRNLSRSAHRPFEESCLKGFLPSSQAANFNKNYFPPPDLPPGYTPKIVQSSFINIASSSNETVSKGNIGTGRFLNRFAFTAVDRTKMMQNRFSDNTAQSTAVDKTNLRQSRFSDIATQSTPEKLDPVGMKEQENSTPSLLSTSTEDSRQETDIKPFQTPLRFPTVLSTKFVSSTLLEEEETAYGLIKPSSLVVPRTVEGAVKEETTEQHKCQRLIEEWHPIALLCKRFNIPDPFPESKTVGTLKSMSIRPSGQKVSIFRSLFEIPVPVMTEQQGTETSHKNLEPSSSGEAVSEQTGSDHVSNEASGSTEWERGTQKQPVEPEPEEDYSPPTPPTLDLFKAIFQDSSSDDGSEESENESVKDADTQNQEPTTLSQPIPETVSIVEVSPVPVFQQAESNFYGPSLPPAGIELLKPSSLPASITPPKKHHKDHKRKHSHHKKHKKHKKKKSKRASNESDDSVVEISDSGSDDDVDIKLIKRLKQLKKSKHK